MCGISGYILRSSGTVVQAAFAVLLDGLRQRGPDDEGLCLIDRQRGIFQSFMTTRSHVGARLGLRPWDPQLSLRHDAAFFHTRFSVIDISSGGHQPFVSADGKTVLIFNGEIYNYQELRRELASKGLVFRTASDTEVLLQGYGYWREDLWARLNGFWAVAIYDCQGALVLCRDRLGVAPLYIRETAEGLFFSSLIAPLKALAPVVADSDVLRGFIDTGFKDVDERTFYQGITSLPPAVSYIFQPGMASLSEAIQRRFWSLPSMPLTTSEISLDEAVEQVRALLFDAVRLRLRADVPLACELSGGLDSSSVVAAATQLAGRKMCTYTLKVRGRDEEPFARAMRTMYDLDYRVVEPEETGLADRARAFARVMEEPYDTPANIWHHELLQRIKADGFHVVLTGAGGDETLAGYEASFWPKAYAEWRAYDRIEADWYEFRRRYRSWPAARFTWQGYGRALLRRHHARSTQRSAGTSVAGEQVKASRSMDFYAYRCFHVTTALLPYYLRSTDHYTMNIPLEHRFPLLDYRLLELGLRLPVEYLFRDGWTKYVLRKAMEPFLPASIVWRQQKFGFPFAHDSFFIAQAAEWAPVWDQVCRGLASSPAPSYQQLAATDPLLLWRFLSAGLWSQEEAAC